MLIIFSDVIDQAELYKNFLIRQDLQDIQDSFSFQHFPEESIEI